MRRARLVVILAAAGLACTVAMVACRSAQDPRDVAPSPESAPDVAWRDKTHEQRRAHMKSVVLPLMKAAFARFDAERFAAFDCRTCHGAGAADESFKMPNPDLPQLPGAADGFETLMAQKEKVTTFMANIVVPGMAAMIGERPFDPSTPDGFGCFRCHVMKR